MKMQVSLPDDVIPTGDVNNITGNLSRLLGISNGNLQFIGTFPFQGQFDTSQLGDDAGRTTYKLLQTLKQAFTSRGNLRSIPKTSTYYAAFTL